jgi:hypothetical protein
MLPSHVSVVQALSSSHSASLRQQPGIGMWTQPVAGSHVSSVQTSLSSHTIGVKTQTLFSQVSVVHALLSLQSLALLHWTHCWPSVLGIVPVGQFPHWHVLGLTVPPLPVQAGLGGHSH